MFRVPTISLGSQLTKSAWSTALLKILQTRVTQRPGCRASGAHDRMQTFLDATANHHSSAERFAASLPKDQTLAILREIDETEKMMRTERVLWPEAGMVVHHTRMERAHVGLLMRATGTSQSSNPEWRSSPIDQATAPFSLTRPHRHRP